MSVLMMCAREDAMKYNIMGCVGTEVCAEIQHMISCLEKV